MTINVFALYSDLNARNPKSKPVLQNIESIYQSIVNILSTPVGTRLFNRDFGCDLESLNFELLDFVTVELATYVIFNAINTYEPRVTVSNQSVLTPDSVNHVLDLYLVFEVQGLEGQTFTLNLSIQK